MVKKGKKVKKALTDKQKIVKLEKCVKDKDKRLSKIEGYFWIRNRVIGSIIISIICLFPIYWLVTIFNETKTYLTTLSFNGTILMSIGIFATIIISIFVWFVLIVVIWEE